MSTVQIPGWISLKVEDPHFKPQTNRWHDKYDRYITVARDHANHEGDCRCGTGRRRMTTASAAYQDKENLFDYYAQYQAIGLADSEELREELVNLREAELDGQLQPWEAKKAYVQIMKKAKYLGGGDEAADMGTFFHSITEEIDHGRLTVEGVEQWVKERVADDTILPSQAEYRWTEMAQAWVDLRDSDEGFEVFEPLIEKTVVNWDYDWAGTADRFGIDKTDGQWKVIDLKTGKINWDAGKFSAQLGGYAIGDVEMIHFDDAGNMTYDALPEGLSTTEGLLIHVPLNEPEKAAIYRVPLERAGTDTLPLCAKVYEEREASRATVLERVIGIREIRGLPDTRRKCGQCREPGHTKAKCPQLNTPMALLPSQDTRTRWERVVDEVEASPAAFDRVKAEAGEEWTGALLNRARARLGLPPK